MARVGRLVLGLVWAVAGVIPALGGVASETHWAFRAPVEPEVPRVRTPGWGRGWVDGFVLARLEGEGMSPSAEAPSGVWLRRVGFDLVGLAPTPVEQDAFEADVRARGEAAYVAAVDRLLASPRFGERQAQEWLDLARYADTHGFNNDSTRTMWRWRDWVIQAFNDGMPYDRFLTEQLAGDLLESPTLEQRVATGFCRNHVVNSEGGIIDEEYRVEYVADRVRTLGMAALGLTLECARCHDHKHDPISQRDYYRLFALFNQVPEVGEDGRIGNAAPLLVAPDRAGQEELEALDRAIERETASMAAFPIPAAGVMESVLERLAAPPRVPAPPDAVFVLGPGTRPEGNAHPQLDSLLEPAGRTNLVLPLRPAAFSAAQPWTLATWVRWRGGEGPILSNMDLLTDPSAGGYGRGAEVRVNGQGQVEVRLAEFWPAYAIQVSTEECVERGEWRHVAVSFDGTPRAAGLRVFLDGRSADLVLRRDGLTGRSGAGHAPRVGATVSREPACWNGELAGLRFYGAPVESGALERWVDGQRARWLAAHPGERDHAGGAAAALVRRASDPGYAARWQAREALRLRRQQLWRESPQTMVMAEREPARPTYLLKRGHYAARGEAVEAGVPGALGVAWPEGAPRNRLGLARWLFQPGHPLTARVAVNRVWAQLFGVGLVRTVEDFGLQGERPSHPELLDALAGRFVASGWDIKRLFRELVLSATYRQDSAGSGGAWERDPANRWLARGPRVRLPAETLRDHALELGGLLRHRLGGPSVFPPQPESLYQGVVVAADYPGTRWVSSEGEDRYRRSLYTFWKRTVPHPVMTTFDAPDREFCSARRLPTNTPLQALALMNEPGFVEAGAGLGRRACREGGDSDADRLSWLFRLGTGRLPDAGEQASLERTLETVRRLGVAGEGHDPEAAVWAAMGSLVLNLDQTITKD